MLLNIVGYFYPLEDSEGECYFWFNETTYYVTTALGLNQNYIMCGTPSTNITGIPPPSVKVTVMVYSVSAVNADFTDCQSWRNQPMQNWIPNQYALLTVLNGVDKGNKNIYIWARLAIWLIIHLFLFSLCNPILECNQETVPRLYSATPSSIEYDPNHLVPIELSGNFYVTSTTLAQCLFFIPTPDYTTVEVIGAELPIGQDSLTCYPPPNLVINQGETLFVDVVVKVNWYW